MNFFGLFGSRSGATPDRADYAGAPGAFDELDIVALKKGMRLEQRGKERGTQQSPPEDMTGFDDVEQEIVTRIETDRRESHNVYIDQLRSYRERAANLGFRQRLDKLASAADKAVGDLKKLENLERDRLYQARKAVVLSSRELERFRTKHRLTRHSRHPHSWIFHIGVIFTIVIVETIMNGSFLAEGNEFGLVGGMILAGLIAALNLAYGFAVGRWIAPLTICVGMWKRVLGFLSLPVMVTVELFLALVVAHYRDAMVSGPLDAPGKYAVELIQRIAFSADMVRLGTMESWLLALMTLTFWIIAAIDGWKFDDPYPGYGRISRRHEADAENYYATKSEIFDGLTETRDNALEEMSNAAGEIDERKGELRSIKEGRIRLFRQFDEYLSHLEQVGNDLLQTYREANRRARPTPAPRHFSERWKMARPNIAGDAAPDTAPETEIVRALEEFEARRTTVHSAFDHAVATFEQIEHLTAEDMDNGRTNGSQKAVEQPAAQEAC
ncbi:hypothetical protein F1643_06045 [Azospirillum sp. INR13]|uniref:hypothetical protein n=1 Tax=Azospirillum sp. INR13 TaxID=2596919 RepID=UPI0018920DB0|nr:hypothetical protein [Azospirillum sp. INR13]MBF5094112.1 hypothetical protein [Azospirillum sp. INR13]